MPNTDTKRRNSPEAAALNDLLNTMNNPDIQGVVVPPGVSTKVVEPEPPVLDPTLIGDRPTGLPEPAPLLKPAYIAQPPEPAKPRVSKLFFTGRMQSGKDTSATAAGAEIISFAAPLYAIASYYFHTEISATVGKDLHGIREFLQITGQWGRGIISEKYPLNVGRALFIARVRAGGPKGLFGFPEVAWDTYGSNNDIWLNAAIARANLRIAEQPDARLAITNCRFDHEFKRLQADGWVHFHCLCSPATWTKRLAVSHLTPESPAVRDLSEQLAANLDANVLKQLSAQKTGPTLRAIWSDNDAPKPSERLHSQASFLRSIGGVA